MIRLLTILLCSYALTALAQPLPGGKTYKSGEVLKQSDKRVTPVAAVVIPPSEEVFVLPIQLPANATNYVWFLHSRISPSDDWGFAMCCEGVAEPTVHRVKPTEQFRFVGVARSLAEPYLRP